MRRSLLDAAAPAPAAEAGDARQECPSPDTVRQYGRFLPTLADEYEAVFQADASGQPLTQRQVQLAPFVLDKPNEFAVLVSFLRDPARLAAYVRDACTTSAIPTAAFPLYARFLLDISPPSPGADVVVCRDNFLAMEQHVRGIVDANEECVPPFGERPDCFGTSFDIPWTPTTARCATALATAYNISTPVPLTTVATSMQDLHATCTAAQSKVSCDAVDGSTQRNTIRNAWTMFPLRAPLPAAQGASATAPQGTPPVLTLEGSGPAGAPAAPGAGGGPPVATATAPTSTPALSPQAVAAAGGGGAVTFAEEDAPEEASGAGTVASCMGVLAGGVAVVALLVHA